jgi:DNA-directed RNA polymerase specialized sigma24 family protein
MNVTIDWLRKKQIRGGAGEFDDAVQLKEIDPASRTAPHPDALPHERMEQGEIRQRIDAAIAQLSAEHRAVILLKEIEDMQYPRNRGVVRLLDRHGHVPLVLRAQETSEFVERCL